MCEALRCKAKGRYWVRRDSMNLIVCGRHLPRTVNRFRAIGSDAYQSYGIVPFSAITVKVVNEKGAWH